MNEGARKANEDAFRHRIESALARIIELLHHHEWEDTPYEFSKTVYGGIDYTFSSKVQKCKECGMLRIEN